MTIKPQNLEERLVWYTIVGTYGFYLLGAQFIWVPILAYFLGLRLCKKLWDQTKDTPVEEKISIPISVWLWIISMLVMEITLIMAHIDFDLGWSKMIFTTVNAWARTWALMGLFPLIGCLNIRPQLIYRAACILCLQSLVLTIVCYLLLFAKIPDLFTNFANNLGIVGNVYFFITSQEANKKWRLIGMIGAAAMVVGSGSRSTLFSLAIVPILTWLLTNFTGPMQIAAGVSALITGMIAPQVIDFLDNTWNKTIRGYRGSSALVRKRLKEVALDRWTEAPIWGHGFVAERGPKYTENMPIGSHNQWPDLLYIRGITGFTAFLVVMLWSTAELIIKAQKSAIAKAVLSIYLVFWVATSAVDIEASAYLYWPGLILSGIAFKEKTSTVPSLKSYTVT